MDGRSLKSLGGGWQRGAGGPWDGGGVVHQAGLNVGSKRDRAGHLGRLVALACRQRRSPLAGPKAAANAMPPLCSLWTWTRLGRLLAIRVAPFCR